MIAKETVLNKMLAEIQLAKTKVHDEEGLLEHVKNVQLLSELLIESGTQRTEKVKHSEIDEHINTALAVQQTSKSKTDDDGMSIFDF